MKKTWKKYGGITHDTDKYTEHYRIMESGEWRTNSFSKVVWPETVYTKYNRSYIDFTCSNSYNEASDVSDNPRNSLFYFGSLLYKNKAKFKV